MLIVDYVCRKSKVDKYFIKISVRQFNMSAACLATNISATQHSKKISSSQPEQ